MVQVEVDVSLKQNDTSFYINVTVNINKYSVVDTQYIKRNKSKPTTKQSSIQKES